MDNSWIGRNVKCVCIETIPIPPHWPHSIIAPVEGCEYTIRDHGMSAKGAVAILLEEIVNPAFAKADPFPEPSFDAAYFRPLISELTDAELEQRERYFERFLNPTDQDIDDIIKRDSSLEELCARLARDAARGKAGL